MNKKLSLVVLSLLCFSLIFFIFVFVSKPQLVGWDEAGYILQGYQLNQAFKSFDWSSLARLTKSQVFYPFFQSWYLGLATLPFVYSINSARLVSLFLFWPLTLLLWQMAKELRPKNHLFPILAVGLVFSSPTILYFFSLAMMEGLGLLLTMTCLWFYWQSREKNQPAFFFLAGLTAQVVVFIKYNYGLVLGALLVTEGLIWFFGERGYKRKNTWLSLFLLFTPIIVFSLWWFFLPGNKQIILGFIKSFNDYPASWLTHWLFYLFELALGYTFSWIAFIFLAVSFVWTSIKHRHQLKVRSLALLFLINFFMIMLKSPNKNQARYLFTSIPAFFLVASLSLIELWPKIKRIRLKPMVLGIFLPFIIGLGVILLWDLARVPQMIKPSGSHQMGSFVFYESDYHITSHFDFDRQNWARREPPPGTENIEDVFDFAFHQVDLSKRITQVGQANEISPHIFNFYLAQAKTVFGKGNPGPYQEYLTVFEVMPGSRFDTQDFRQANWVSALWAKGTLLDMSLELISQKYFPYLGVRVSIMGRR